MKINKKELEQALTIVKPGLANKELLEQTTSFAFLKGRVVTYNDEISISHPIKEIDFEGAINGQELYGLLSRITKDEIDITIKETELLVSSGRIKAGLKLVTEIKLPLKELPDKMEELGNPEQFKQLVGLAMRTCSTDMSQPKLTCVCIKQDGVVIGSDGYRLIYGTGHSHKFPVSKFLLPATSAVEVIKIDPTHISLEKGWAHFKNKEGTVVSCRRLEDDYVPDDRIEEVLKIKEAGAIKFPDKIEEMLDRVQQFAKRDFTLEEKVDISIEHNKVILKASSESTGSWIEEKASIECDKSLSFSVTPSLLADILRMTRSAFVDETLTKMKFESNNWQYILMLKAPKV